MASRMYVVETTDAADERVRRAKKERMRVVGSMARGC